MNLDEATPDAWNGQDLAAMLRHQLAAPLEFDLSSVEMKGAEAKKRGTTLTGAARERIKSFEDLLFHREPPLALLKLSKEFFKRRLQECKKDSGEWNVAYLLYLLSILAVGNRASKISSLTPSDLRKGMKWALERRWMNEKTRQFVELAARAGSA
jgi:hypothetical protein